MRDSKQLLVSGWLLVSPQRVWSLFHRTEHASLINQLYIYCIMHLILFIHCSDNSLYIPGSILPRFSPAVEVHFLGMWHCRELKSRGAQERS